MCLYPGLCKPKIILVHEITAVIWALVIQKQECFHRWEEMHWPGICLVTLGVHLCRKAEGVSVDLWTLAAVTYVNQEDSHLLQQPEAVGHFSLFTSYLHLIDSLTVSMGLLSITHSWMLDRARPQGSTMNKTWLLPYLTANVMQA